jgi:hypothetical protein
MSGSENAQRWETLATEREAAAGGAAFHHGFFFLFPYRRKRGRSDAWGKERLDVELVLKLPAARVKQLR